jgi:hypothetical protein
MSVRMRSTRCSNVPRSPGRSNTMKCTWRQPSPPMPGVRTSVLIASKRPRAIQISPSIGTAGQCAVNHAGGSIAAPLRAQR